MYHHRQIVLILAMACLCAAGPLISASTQTSADMTVGEGTRIVLQLNDHLSTKSNSEGDSFTAVVSAPVFQGDRILIPKGSIVTGIISRVVRPGRFKGKAVMTLIFQTIRIPGRREIPIMASLAKVDSEGGSEIKSESSVQSEGTVGRDIGRVAKPGLAGAGIGALAGGARGSAVGAGVGAAVGLATVFATRGKDLEVRRGATMEIVLDRPLVLQGESSDITTTRAR